MPGLRVCACLATEFCIVETKDCHMFSRPMFIRLSQRRKTQSLTVPVPVIRPAGRFCIELLPCISSESNSSKVDWRPGKRRCYPVEPYSEAFQLDIAR